MRKSSGWLTACVLLGAAVFLYLQLFILPDLPVLPSGDQPSTSSMGDGCWRVRSFIAISSSLCFLVLNSFILHSSNYSGVRAWVPNAALVLLGVGFVWTSAIISRRLFEGASIILPGFLFLAIPFRNGFGTGSHHWYSALAVMAALAVLIEKRSPGRLVAAGALCGLSAWFNQTRGPAGLLGFAIFLLWERYQTKETWRSLLGRVVPLFGGFVVTLVALSSYFVWKAGLNHFLDSTVVFLLKYFPRYPLNRWGVYRRDMPSLENWYSTTPLGKWLVVELLVPWVYFLFFLCARRERKLRPQEPWDRLMLVSIVGFCLFLSVAPSALNYRLCTVSLPAFILVVWFAKWPGRIERVALPFLWIGLLALMIAETYSIQTQLACDFGSPCWPGRLLPSSRPRGVPVVPFSHEALRLSSSRRTGLELCTGPPKRHPDRFPHRDGLHSARTGPERGRGFRNKTCTMGGMGARR